MKKWKEKITTYICILLENAFQWKTEYKLKYKKRHKDNFTNVILSLGSRKL